MLVIWRQGKKEKTLLQKEKTPDPVHITNRNKIQNRHPSAKNAVCITIATHRGFRNRCNMGVITYHEPITFPERSVQLGICMHFTATSVHFTATSVSMLFTCRKEASTVDFPVTTVAAHFYLFSTAPQFNGSKRKNRNYTRNNRKKKGLSRGQIGIQSLVTVLFSAIDGSAQLNDGHFHIFLRPVCVHKYKYNPRLWSCWQQWFAQHNPHLIGLRGTTSHGSRNWTSIEATCD